MIKKKVKRVMLKKKEKNSKKRKKTKKKQVKINQQVKIMSLMLKLKIYLLHQNQDLRELQEYQQRRRNTWNLMKMILSQSVVVHSNLIRKIRALAPLHNQASPKKKMTSLRLMILILLL